VRACVPLPWPRLLLPPPLPRQAELAAKKAEAKRLADLELEEIAKSKAKEAKAGSQKAGRGEGPGSRAAKALPAICVRNVSRCPRGGCQARPCRPCLDLRRPLARGPQVTHFQLQQQRDFEERAKADEISEREMASRRELTADAYARQARHPPGPAPRMMHAPASPPV
jgi:hypothetical protein